MNPKVFCPELDCFVSGSEVWELMHGKECINKELSFVCPDIGCGVRMIVSRCYAHNKPWEVIFKTYPRELHAYGCAFVAAQKAERYKKARSKIRSL